MKNCRCLWKKYSFLWLSPILLVSLAWAQDEIVDFDSGRWELQPGSKIVEYLGQKSLRGSAVLKDVVFENGVIEVDIAFTGGRCFPAINFRKQSQGNDEEFYIRPHKSGKPDALQYTPRFNGVSAWQLYYGPGATAARTLTPKKWLHVKLEVSGTQARVFLNNSKSPALVIPDLKRGISKGGLGLTTLANGTAHFANFSFRHDENLEFTPPPVVETPLGMIMDWELSQAIKYNLIDRRKYPDPQELQKMTWQRVKAESSGVVNIARYAQKGPVLPGCVLARTFIDAEQDRLMPFQFGYSDIVSVFLNGQILFYGSSVFQSRDPFFQGRVGLFDVAYLPLKKGKNELLLMLAESMGGWGFMGCDGDAVYQHESVTKLWEIPYELSYPETVVYDKKRDKLYVSNLYSDGIQYISKLTLTGQIEELEWISGLTQPTGMAVQDDKLFVVERANLVEIDIPAGKIVKRHAVPNPRFLNDIAVGDKGEIYISDGQKAQILKFQDGQFSVWAQGRDFAAVNGLHFHNGHVYAGTSGDASIKAIDAADPEAKARILARFDQGAIVDGIESDGKGNLLVSDYNGKVFLISGEGRKALLLNTTTPRRFCANFAYIPEKHMLIIPTLNDNRLIAYKIGDGP